ncbi:hypothetical protein KAS50_01480, partial [bacterium]|nr:hypothetical protein [bacterium]
PIRMYILRKILISSAAVVAVICFGTISYSYASSELDITPEELYQKLLDSPAIKEYPKGGKFCWRARIGMNEFIDNYKETKDTRWLAACEKYNDFLINNMDTDPDGYKGWIGPHVGNKKRWGDEQVSDAILMTSILDFSVLVLEDESLKKVYGEKAKSYLEIAKKDFFEKWDRRDCWREDGAYGAYVFFYKYLEPGNLTEWKSDTKRKVRRQNMPFNMQLDVVQVCLRVYRLTGEKFYRDKAEKICLYTKRRFQYFDDHYVWSYWEPFGLGDIDFENKTTRHWVGVHPYRSGYQAGEVKKIAEAYHYGLVFNEQDIKRMINTNLEVMWNKDLENPDFINSNGLAPDTTGLGAFRERYGHSNVKRNSGQLWTGLLDFSQTIRDIYSIQLKNESKKLARFKKWAEENPPGFKRKFAKGEISVPQMDFTDCRYLNMAAVMPNIIEEGKESVIICKSWKAGELEIALYSKNGKIKTLYKGPIEGSSDNGSGFFLVKWDGTNPDKNEKYKGDYRIRWTFGNEYREFPVVIK